jgi:ATP-dependent helicase HrpA
MRAQLESIAPADLLEQYTFAELPHLTRFLKAMRLRAERAKDSIQRDIEKSKRVAPYEARSAALLKLAKTAAQQSEVKAYRMLLEEFKVSVYAQELGTAQKVSEKRLDKLADELERKLK